MDEWIRLRNDNVFDDDLFDEYDAQAKATQQFLDEAEKKLRATELKWDGEKILKEARDLQDAKD